MIVLICGLSGTGKTTLADSINMLLNFHRINGDEMRKKHDDWDFSIDGRFRQARRIREEAMLHKDVLIDFICPLKEMRTIINADFIIYMNTKTHSKYKDTDSIFIPPCLPEVTLEEWPTTAKAIMVSEKIKAARTKLL